MAVSQQTVLKAAYGRSPLLQRSLKFSRPTVSASPGDWYGDSCWKARTTL